MLFIVLLATGIISGLYLWKRNNDNYYLKIAFACFGGLITSVWSLVSNSIYEFPSQMREMNYYTTQGLRAVFIGCIIFLVIKEIGKRK